MGQLRQVAFPLPQLLGEPLVLGDIEQGHPAGGRASRAGALPLALDQQAQHALPVMGRHQPHLEHFLRPAVQRPRQGGEQGRRVAAVATRAQQR